LLYPETKLFKELFSQAEKQLDNHLPFVLYRTPGNDLITGVFQNDAVLHRTDNFSKAGFVFGPFTRAEQPILLLPDRYYTASDVPAARTKMPVRDHIIEDSNAADSYKKLVAKAVKNIQEGTLRKVVLSRKIQVRIKKQPLDIFHGILERYHTAFCYCWYHPAVGLWVGATPELLMRLEAPQFRTVALAGTKRIEGNEPPEWGQKEREEQELVTDYILTALKGHVNSLKSDTVESVKAGKLWHLRTRITGQMTSAAIGPVIRALHPTSAVCGMPLEAALTFLLNNEPYDRRYYTGYLGELNLGTDAQTHLYVNLRCMEIKDQMAHIYVGGGITKDSDPELEWQETVAKSETMLHVL
jgi:isochorismate synthase